MTLSEQLIETKFGIALTQVLAPLTGKHMEIFLDSKDPYLKYDDIGDAKEKKIKKIGHYYGLLQTVFEDIEMVLAFLRINERKDIQKIYPSIENQESYFRYHVENYFIRMVTITDLVGKLANSIFDPGMDEIKCNAYLFRDKIHQTDPQCAHLVNLIIESTRTIKEKRHQKIHEGKTNLDYFEGIVFWDELAKIIRTDANPLLDKLTTDSIANEIDILEKDIREIIALIVNFTDYSTDKFIAIAK